jgi:hypothetical protein
VANRRIHGTHRQPVTERWQQAKPRLGLLPAADYDTSLKVFRKAYKDCQVHSEASDFYFFVPGKTTKSQLFVASYRRSNL